MKMSWINFFNITQQEKLKFVDMKPQEDNQFCLSNGLKTADNLLK